MHSAISGSPNRCATQPAMRRNSASSTTTNDRKLTRLVLGYAGQLSVLHTVFLDDHPPQLPQVSRRNGAFGRSTGVLCRVRDAVPAQDHALFVPPQPLA